MLVMYLLFTGHNRWIDGQTDQWTNGQTSVCIDKRTGKWMYGCMHGCMDCREEYAMLTSIVRLKQPQAYNVQALPEQGRVCGPCSGSGDQLHHGLQKQLLVVCAVQHLAVRQAQSTPHGPHQRPKRRLNSFSPISGSQVSLTFMLRMN